MTYWLFFALITPLLWGFANVMDCVIRRHFVKDDMAATWFLSITRLPVIIAIFLIAGFKMPKEIVPVLFMIFGGMLWMFPYVLYYKAIEFEEPSRVILLMQLTPVFTIILAFLGIKEILTITQSLAFILLFLGGSLAAIKRLQTGNWHLSRACWMIIFSSLLWAAADVIFKKFEPQFFSFWDAFAFYLIGGFLFAVFMFLIPSGRKNLTKHFFSLPGRVWKLLFINQVAGLTGSLTFVYALTLGKASLTTVFIGIQPLFVFVLGFLLKRFVPEIQYEDLNKKSLLLKASSFILIIIGLFFLS